MQNTSRPSASLAASDPAHPDQAIVIGAGLGGLASAMRLGAKGWQVTVVDRLDRPGGRGDRAGSAH